MFDDFALEVALGNMSGKTLLQGELHGAKFAFEWLDFEMSQQMALEAALVGERLATVDAGE
jgi:hypothetical protein